jgi:predicted GNAT family acetyltransferase
MTIETRHQPDDDRYEILVDGRRVGIADYRIVGDTYVFHHTEIEPSWRGQGLGAVLVQAALDDVRDRGGHVEPRCWFVAEFIDDHPEYANLRVA